MGLLYSSKVINATVVEQIYRARLDESKYLADRNISDTDRVILLGNLEIFWTLFLTLRRFFDEVFKQKIARRLYAKENINDCKDFQRI